MTSFFGRIFGLLPSPSGLLIRINIGISWESRWSRLAPGWCASAQVGAVPLSPFLPASTKDIWRQEQRDENALNLTLFHSSAQRVDVRPGRAARASTSLIPPQARHSSSSNPQGPCKKRARTQFKGSCADHPVRYPGFCNAVPILRMNAALAALNACRVNIGGFWVADPIHFIRSLLSRHAACITLICAPVGCTMQGPRCYPIFSCRLISWFAPCRQMSDSSTTVVEEGEVQVAALTSNTRHQFSSSMAVGQIM